ncbi:MAG: phosphatidate cytidylyltransferase [Bacteroidales bacterium]|nr:phosphatidate cytidylyltransferase [Bacteroidales bacterium]
MNNMLVRALSGVVYIAVIVGCILGGRDWFLVLVAVFTMLGMAELQRLLSTRVRMGVAARACDLVMAVCLLLGIYGIGIAYDNFTSLLMVAAVYLPVRIVIAVIDRSSDPARVMLYSMLTMIYVAWSLALLYSAYLMSGKEIVLATFIFIWINDTGAYLSGRTFGRHKLCERLSPKKTWEGFWGGFILTLAAGAATPFVLGLPTGKIAVWIVYAAVVSVFGTFGDLFESLIKRNLGVKDSGNIIPGHGGILDRIDSLLAVAPFAALMAFLI